MKPEQFIFIGIVSAMIAALLTYIAIELHNIHELLKERFKGD